MVAVATGVDRG